MNNIINGMIEDIGTACDDIIAFLPASPFHWNMALDNNWLAWINYLFPVQEALTHISTYATAVIVYYGIRIVLRWIKMAGD